MQESEIESQDQAYIRRILKDQKVYNLFVQQLSTVPKHLYNLTVAYSKIFIVIEPHKQDTNAKTHDHQSKYVIKINKNFPLEQSLRVHLLDAHFQPRVSDTRDLFKSIMGQEYNHTVVFHDIVEQLIKFDSLLYTLNEDFISLQRVGVFHLGQTYFYHELAEMYSSITILKDHSQKKSNTYIGISQTHILIFKEILDKNPNSRLSPIKHHSSLVTQNAQQQQIQAQVTYNRLRLICYGDLQCIESLHYCQSEKLVRLIIKKYKSIKSYHEQQQIKRQYKFLKPQIFLRGVLKYITKFQPCEIEFHPIQVEPNLKKKSSQKSRQDETLSQLVLAAGRVEQQLKGQKNVGEQKLKISTINKIYQKIIQYYSARANPYYLIFVNKLNYIYHKYYVSNNNPKQK